jgi:type IV pilus assembly protein PilW
MVVFAIMSIIITATYSVFASVNRTSTDNRVTAEVMQRLRNSFEFMEQDIRFAGLDRFDSADAGIIAATAINLRFTADRNMDGTINTADLSDGIQEQDLEDITYFYDAANSRLRQCLAEGTTNDWETVAEDVSNFQFTFLDVAGNPLAFPIADLSDIRSVQVTMTIIQSTALSGPVRRTLSKRILCRNLNF